MSVRHDEPQKPEAEPGEESLGSDSESMIPPRGSGRYVDLDTAVRLALEELEDETEVSDEEVDAFVRTRLLPLLEEASKERDAAEPEPQAAEPTASARKP